MTLKELREARGLTRKEVAKLSGINLRSLQDYEQGHKDIASAKSETLYRLSIVLGCTMEEILSGYLTILDQEEAEERQYGRLKKYYISAGLSKEGIQKQQLISEKYRVCGKWEFIEDKCNVVFFYKNEIKKLPFKAEFTEKTLPWLVEAAIMKMESYIEDYEFQLNMVADLGGGNWSEW